MLQCSNPSSCAAGNRLRRDFLKAQKHYKSGSPAYKSLEAALQTPGTANDGGAFQVVTTLSAVRSLAWGGAPKKRAPTFTVNLTLLDATLRTPQGEANFAATERHELQHFMDDIAAGDKPHAYRDDFWHEVRGVRAETPTWEGLGQNDPWATWTVKDGSDMHAVYDEAKASADAYCPGEKCP